MLLIYNLGLRLYYLLILLFSAFNKKAKLWIDGRRHVQIKPLDQSIWFHFASLGEFEQGRPVLERYRADYPQSNIVITFFSPSGYEIRKNTPLANAVYYLPLDTAANARHFINTINPSIAVFTKYEYWYHYFNELHKQVIPLYIVSGIFRPGQLFFKWYGGVHRRILSFVTHFFVQNEQSKQLLQSINVNNATISGDTRFDRVWTNAQNPRALSQIEAFTTGKKTFIAGSTWPTDEQLLVDIIKQYPDWKFIIAPHEIGEDKISRLISLLPTNAFIRHSQLNTHHSTLTIQTLIIDNIGMLSSLYQYGDIAYVGGGFGAGIHNTLEAAAFGLPVVFGPNYQKFKEARDLISIGAGFSITDQTSLQTVVAGLVNDDAQRAGIGAKARQFVESNIGATDMIISAMGAKD